MTRLGLIGLLASFGVLRLALEFWVASVPLADEFETALEPALLQLRRGPFKHFRPGIAGASGHA